MTFNQAFRTCFLKKYCDFKGRASRSEFWWFSLSVVGISTLSNLIFQYTLPPQIMVWASLIVSLIFMLPNLAVTVRRLHDRNLRGWWLAAPHSGLFHGAAAADRYNGPHNRSAHVEHVPVLHSYSGFARQHRRQSFRA